MSEPVRKSVYDVLMKNLQLAGRKTFIHRYAYIGEHKNEKEIQEVMENVITEINDDYCEEPLTGFLLLYTNYFVHVIEGCEDCLIKQITKMLKTAEHLLGEVRPLFMYHHVNQRMFDEWGFRHAKPPILLERIHYDTDFEEMKRLTDVCVKKVYNLCTALRKRDEEQKKFVIGEISFALNEYLPEYNLLDFLFHTPYLYDLKNYLYMFNRIPSVQYYVERIWPVRSDFVPYDVFEKERTPVQNLSTYNTKTTENN